MAITTPTTERGRRKADRREAILRAAAAQFAERGYANVTIEDLGQAAGVSGPALYRHFPGKAAVLAEILLDASRRLLVGAGSVLGPVDVDVDVDVDDEVAETEVAEPEPEPALRALIAHHVAFALDEADVILVQDRELVALDAEARHEVRALQRRYVEAWVGALWRIRPADPKPELRVRVHATFGLLNSTPHSARLTGQRPSNAVMRALLEEMAWSALTR